MNWKKHCYRVGSHSDTRCLVCVRHMRCALSSSTMYEKSALAPYKYPQWVEFVPELPKTATGKIQRFKLRG